MVRSQAQAPASCGGRGRGGHHCVQRIGKYGHSGLAQARHVDAARIQHVHVEFLHHAVALRLGQTCRRGDGEAGGAKAGSN